jgi:hypothetical protein
MMGAGSSSRWGSNVTISTVTASGSGGGCKSGMTKLPDNDRAKPICKSRTRIALTDMRCASSSRKLRRLSSS